VYTYSKILSFKDVKGRLPHTAYIKPWVYRPVYIISDIINSVTYDNNRNNILVNELKKLGVNAYNKGVGTDNIGIFQTLPSNALLVQICGGACAGTIYETGSTYYKNLVDTREVFFVWTEGAMKITGLAWLPRAHDDNFSPPGFTGLAHPDQFILSNGYHYYEGYTNDEAVELAKIIYNNAKN
jgi:hypothetical protein